MKSGACVLRTKECVALTVDRYPRTCDCPCRLKYIGFRVIWRFIRKNTILAMMDKQERCREDETTSWLTYIRPVNKAHT